jgi:hypothetical protein
VKATVLQNPPRLRLTVRVQPRASRSRIAGTHGDALKVQVTAPPVGGAANEAVVALLAESFAVRRADVCVVSGSTSRTKVVDIAGADPAILLDRLAAVTGDRAK